MGSSRHNENFSNFRLYLRWFLAPYWSRRHVTITGMPAWHFNLCIVYNIVSSVPLIGYPPNLLHCTIPWPCIFHVRSFLLTRACWSSVGVILIFWGFLICLAYYLFDGWLYYYESQCEIVPLRALGLIACNERTRNRQRATSYEPGHYLLELVRVPVSLIYLFFMEI